MRAFTEINERADRIEVYFKYDPAIKDLVKAIPGARFVGREKCGPDGPHWTVPLDLDNARQLRVIFGATLTLGNGLKEWGRQEVSRERNLGALTTADDAQLKLVPANAPLIDRLIQGDAFDEFDDLPADHPLRLRRDPRPYQRADIAMMAQANVLNANQPGTGKTVEVLGAVVEAGIQDGPHLVSAPVRSLENVWRVEIERWLGAPVYTAEDRTERLKAVTEGIARAKRGEAVWIVVNPDMLRVKKLKPESTEEVVRRDHKGNLYGAQNELHKAILEIDWQHITIDEFHKAGLNNPMSLFTLGTDLLKCQRKYLLSGTPMGGKPIKLFAPLRSIEPQKFSSKWRWAERWLTIENNGFGQQIGGIKSGLEDQFYSSHARHLVRRLKREALPGLPAKQTVEVLCGMTAKQRKQYEQFAKDAETRITVASDGTESKVVVGDCILAEYARLKQFANAYCVLDERERVVPTEDGGKLEQLLERLDEFGIRKVDPEPGARAIVASQSKRMVEMVAAWLKKQGVDCDTLTGDTKDSQPLIKRFQSADETPYVIVMTTQTGGVSLNLERAGSVHILDESWNPDDEEQLEDRGDRGSRTTPLICLYYRTRGTIQQEIAQVAEHKKITNRTVLDVYREIQRIRKER